MWQHLDDSVKSKLELFVCKDDGTYYLCEQVALNDIRVCAIDGDAIVYGSLIDFQPECQMFDVDMIYVFNSQSAYDRAMDIMSDMTNEYFSDYEEPHYDEDW